MTEAGDRVQFEMLLRLLQGAETALAQRAVLLESAQTRVDRAAERLTVAENRVEHFQAAVIEFLDAHPDLRVIDMADAPTE